VTIKPLPPPGQGSKAVRAVVLAVVRLVFGQVVERKGCVGGGEVAVAHEHLGLRRAPGAGVMVRVWGSVSL
jgi:hypothetical protein